MMDGFSVRDERWSVERIAEEARAHLAQREAEIAAASAKPEQQPAPAPRAPRIPRSPSALDRTHLYVIRSRETVKIGYAANLYLRVSAIGVDNPHGAELVEFFDLPKNVVLDIERFCHIALAERRVSGEWFAVPLDEARAVVAEIKATVLKLYRLE